MSAITAVQGAKLLTWFISKNGLHAKPWLKNQEWLKMEKYDLERIVKESFTFRIITECMITYEI